MSPRRRIDETNSAPESTSQNYERGRLLEVLVARIQAASSSDVKTRALLPAKNDSSRTREIDVLVTIPWVLKSLHVAFECRNWSRKVRVKDISEFADKLLDVGIPATQGIYVTTVGYTRDAEARARELGIQTLVLEGLTPDRLTTAVHRALHTTAVVFLQVFALQPLNDVTAPGQQFERPLSISLADFDEALGPILGMAPHVSHLLSRLSDLWLEGHIPQTLGVHGGAFRVPDGFTLPNLEPIRRGLIWCNLRVHAVMFSREGTVELLSLYDAASRAQRQRHAVLGFPEPHTSYSERVIESEEELSNLLREVSVVPGIIERVACPRIQFGTFWWPVSPHALKRAKKLQESGVEPSFLNVEGPNLARAWLEDPRVFSETGGST